MGSLERECGRGTVDELIEPLSPGVLSRDGVNGRRYFRPERFFLLLLPFDLKKAQDDGHFCLSVSVQPTWREQSEGRSGSHCFPLSVNSCC